MASSPPLLAGAGLIRMLWEQAAGRIEILGSGVSAELSGTVRRRCMLISGTRFDPSTAAGAGLWRAGG